MTASRRLPPIWLMGLTNSLFGLLGGFAVVTVPEMLAAQGVSGGHIAVIVAAILSPGFWAFLCPDAGRSLQPQDLCVGLWISCCCGFRFHGLQP